MSDDLVATLGTEETPGLEFKESAKDTKAIRQAICAFANDLPNLGGGDLLVGVTDKGIALDDVDTSDRTQLALSDIRDSGKIIDRPSMVVSKAVFRGKHVIHIHVEASSTPPVRLDGVVWVRPGPTTRRATRDDERVLSERRRYRDSPFDSRPAFDTSIEDIDMLRFRSDVLPAFVSPEVLEENGRPVEMQLASIRITDAERTPTNMGLLLVGLNPSGFIPGAYLQFIRYSGLDVDAPVIDAQELRGNILDSVDRLQSMLLGHLHTSIQATSAFAEKDRPEYPIEALREACLNAVIHRNYESSNAPIRIAWFDDRIEITNPGGPYGSVRADNFDRINDYRNPSLAGAMKELGFVNRFGRGIGRIQAALKRNGNPLAEFLVDESSWMVSIRRAS
ncbi:ATP-binding protein [Actinophytocola glycyrrhizae]|uniref:ATP-binding protein n=1 Tax=Actinophytocola glycyrrhizae TaxID=2044873 RepID=A0ABV9S0B8_9PSEU